MFKSFEWSSIYIRFIFCVVVDALVCIVILLTLQNMLKQATPPEGFVFNRLPEITGIYTCCDSGRSRINGNVSLNCSEPDFMQGLGSGGSKHGSSESSCGLQKELNGKRVTVVRVLAPTIGLIGASPRVIKITSDGHIFYEVNDKDFRDQWIEKSNLGIVGVVTFIGMIIIFILTIVVVKPNQSNKPKKNLE